MPATAHSSAGVRVRYYYAALARGQPRALNADSERPNSPEVSVHPW